MQATVAVPRDAVWRAPEWYRALSVVERLAPARADGAQGSAGRPTDDGLRRLHAWKAERPFDRGSLFADRLALDSLSERDLVALLSEPAASLKARTAGPPHWLAALEDAFTGWGRAATVGPVLDDVESDHPLAPCVPALGPLLERGHARIAGRVEELRRRHGSVPVDAQSLSRFFLTNVVPSMLFQVSKPVVLEMHIARLRGGLDGETSEARFEFFMRRLAEDGGLASLLVKYPVLARQLVLTIDQWTDYLCEFLTHLCADWQRIRTTFAAGGDPGVLVDLDAGKGDRHRRGRSVLLMRFAGGMQLVYKPKPLAVDVHFQELLSWLNDRGADPPLRPLTLLDRGDYGWSEFVAASSCTSPDEVVRFFERQGAYLALLYALDGTDLHNENLVAAGEHPMLVDLEALFHPHVYGEDPGLAGNLAASALDESVWQVGILPRRVWSDEESLGVDMSGLGGRPGQMNPHPIVSWDGAGSDEIRVSRERVELPVSDNLPRLNGSDVDVVQYRDAILAGFTTMYRLLARHRDDLLGEQLSRFAHDEVRVVVRSTNVYGLLLYESFHPDLLRDALDRDRFFDRLWREVARRPYIARVIRAERQDLARGDIPTFSTTPDSRTLYTSEGEAVHAFFDAPSLDRVRRRVGQLGERDLREQTWIIEASLATVLMEREDRIGRRVTVPPTDGPAPKEELLALASALGRRLDELALQDEIRACWLGVGPLDESAWGLFPSGIDLYAGTTGIALFLAYLGAVTEQPSRTRLARRALTSLRPQVRAWLEAEEEDEAPLAARPTPGAFEGLASVTYLLTHLGALWAEPALLREADSLVPRLRRLIASDERLDVIYGSAGCLLALLSLHAVHPSRRTLAAAVECGDRLLATARPMAEGMAWTTLDGEPPLCGFSHGAAGIALSLLQLADRSGDKRFRDAALAALAYERSLFDPKAGNWADLRHIAQRPTDQAGVTEPAGALTPTTMVAWCHGAAGIGLGRLASLRYLDDEEIRGEIDAAVATTIGHGFAMNHSLCHGALGNVELLLLAARLLDRPEDHEALAEATALVVSSIKANGPVTGVPLGVETPGFMTGLAGIGYGLLRLAAPDEVPCALLLAPPDRHARR
jgi:type 2 lantibiotic biosynthesis protein LanM